MSGGESSNLRSLLQQARAYLRNSLGVPMDYAGAPRVTLIEDIDRQLAGLPDETICKCGHPMASHDTQYGCSQCTCVVVVRAAAPETKAPTRDAEHCDYPDCGQHWSYVASLQRGLLTECRPYVVKADIDAGAHAHHLLRKIDVALKNSPAETSDSLPMQRLRMIADAAKDGASLTWIRAVAEEGLRGESLAELSQKTSGAESSALDSSFEIARRRSGVDEPLEVYTSNSYRRVGTKGEYHVLLYATRQRDGTLDISNYTLLEALVAAFNAMLIKDSAGREEHSHD
jgi:hypothetical protein